VPVTAVLHNIQNDNSEDFRSDVPEMTFSVTRCRVIGMSVASVPRKRGGPLFSSWFEVSMKKF